MAVWRRLVMEGAGLNLTLAEAAALLGTSVGSVRRRIRSGHLRAFYDDEGRLRIPVSLPSGRPAREKTREPDPDLDRLRKDLAATRQELEQSLTEIAGLKLDLGLANALRQDVHQDLVSAQNQVRDLQEELDNTRQSLDHYQDELASLWRVMSAREPREKPAFETHGNEAFDLASKNSRLDNERARIESQISRVRHLSRRRRWPRLQTG